MTYRRGLALAFVVICAACSSGGGSGDLIDTGPEQPAFNPQAPANSYEGPVDSYGAPPRNGTEQPEFNDDAPPTSGASSPPLGGGGVPTCQQICSQISRAGCSGAVQGECVQECSNPDEEIAACMDEYLALLGCVLSSSRFVCENGEPSVDIDDLFEDCPSQVAAFVDCAQVVEPGPPPPGPRPGGDCTLEAGCVCGNDLCDSCICATGDEELCAELCG